MNFRSLTNGAARMLHRFARRMYRADEGDEVFFGDEYGTMTDSGEAVSDRNAYTFHGWYRALDLISSQVAKTNIVLWDRRGDRKKKATNHFAYKLFSGHGTPNDETLSYHFVQTLTAHAVGHGGGFAYIIRNEYGHAVELLQLRPDRTYPIRENGQLFFVTSIGGDYGTAGSETLKLLAENVLHIHGLGWDGLTGYSVKDMAKRAIGCAIAKEKFGSRYFRNAAKPSVLLQAPRKLSEKAYQSLKNSWNEVQPEMSEAHKAVILEDGVEAVPFSHSASEAQLTEACERDPVIVSNFTGVPPHLLGVKGYNSNSTLETQSQNLLDFTIDPWMIPWEQELNAKLLRVREIETNSHEFLFARKELIRVDAAKRSAMHRTALGGHPYKKLNEVREDEDLDIDEDGDFIPQPLNMGKLGEPLPAADPPNPDTETEDSGDADEAVRQLWQQTLSRMTKRIETARSRSASVDETTLKSKHGDVIREAVKPLLAISRSNISAEILTDRIVAGDSVDQLLEQV